MADGYDSRPALVGLTGGIGSGKSTVASIFSGLGVPVLDLDQIGQQVTTSNPEAVAALVKAFGREILDGDRLNRKRLAEICFSSREKTKQLNGILHPLIWQQMEGWINKQQAAYVIIEASVLIESGGCDRMDATIVVVADLPLRKQRVLSRGMQTARSFDRIVEVQCNDAERKSHADFLIRNDGAVEALKENVERLHGVLTGQFGS
ncbi:MAG: dephospho-CoA kinase [Mariprofundaceae bacterium]|nr:dephospho-CoA kinase [Mariprofundaceae bacterium]